MYDALNVARGIFWWFQRMLCSESLRILILGILEGGKGAITQIVAAHIVRCRIPGPCVASSDSLKRNDGDLDTDNENSEILKGSSVLNIYLSNINLNGLCIIFLWVKLLEHREMFFVWWWKFPNEVNKNILLVTLQFIHKSGWFN